MLNKTVYFIRSTRTGCMWSRNRWATPTATPDFYDTRKAALLQVETGKVYIIERHRLMKPEIAEAIITELVI